MKNAFIILLPALLLSSIQCKREPAPNTKQIVTETPVAAPLPTPRPAPPPPPIAHTFLTYRLRPLNKETVSWLRALQSMDTPKVLFALNRVDSNHLMKQDTLVVPDEFKTDLNSYSPFPDTVPCLKEIHKIILFSYFLEAFSAYENGTLVRWGPASMGKRSTPTPVGLYHTNWKAKQTVSTDNGEWIMNWYFNLENKKGISMHEYDLPGAPASHACIRLLPDDANWAYHWCDQWILANDTAVAAYGTPVLVYGRYDFGNRKPWRNLGAGNHTPSLSPYELQQEASEFLPAIRQRQEQRDSLAESKR